MAGNPEGLASALEKLGSYSRRIPLKANPSTAHMFIVNPLSGRGMANLFCTHPPLQERIARLRGTKTDLPVDKEGDRGKREAEAFWRHLSK